MTDDWRNPIEKRRDEIAARYGKAACCFTPDVLRLIANGPIYDVTHHYCPAGRLSMEEARAREAAQIEIDEEQK